MSRRIKKRKQQPKKSAADEYSEEQLIDKSVFDHLEPKPNAVPVETEAVGGFFNTFNVIIIGSILVGALVFSGAFTGDINFGSDNDGPSGPLVTDNGSSQSLTSLCIQHENLASHYHFTLNVILFGSPTNIPANVGVEINCMRVMHTHSADNRIHVETPTGYTGSLPNLGHFFEIWGQSLSDTSLMGQTGSVSLTVRLGGNIIFEQDSGDLSSYAPGDNSVVELNIV